MGVILGGCPRCGGDLRVEDGVKGGASCLQCGYSGEVYRDPHPDEGMDYDYRRNSKGKWRRRYVGPKGGSHA